MENPSDRIRGLLRDVRLVGGPVAGWMGLSQLPYPDYPDEWGGRLPVDGVTAPLHYSRISSSHATTIGPSFRNVYGNTEGPTEQEREQVANYADYAAGRAFRATNSLPEIPGIDSLTPSQQYSLRVASNRSRLADEKGRLNEKFRKEQDWIRLQRRLQRHHAESTGRMVHDQQLARQRAADAKKAEADAAPQDPHDPFRWLPQANAQLAQVEATGQWTAPRVPEQGPQVHRITDEPGRFWLPDDEVAHMQSSAANRPVRGRERS